MDRFLPSAEISAKDNAKFAKLFLILKPKPKIIMKNLFLTALLLFFVSAVPAWGQNIDYEKLSKHPRLLLTAGDVGAMKDFRARSANAAAVHDKILAKAESYLATEPVERVITGKRLLSISREALKRIFYLSYSYVMTEDQRYAARAEKEMLGVSEFEDWNPSHFLDVAEMTMAMAIGYDWLNGYLSRHSRSIIGTAIYEKGLKAAEKVGDGGFFKATHNWNQVCNAGLIYGALATMERSPEYCKALIAKCLESNPLVQKAYNPDGVYPEGYSYWDYGTSFEVMLVAALQSALGTDAGIAAQQSFMRSVEFMTYMVAPSGLCYNFADSGAGTACVPSKYWFARQTKNGGVVATDELMIKQGRIPEDRLLPIYMIFGSSLNLDKLTLPKEKVWVGRGEVPIYVYRSGWESKEDTYFAIKGGHASTNHAHMDAGSFIYEWGGVRWAIDLGMHDYHRLEQAGVDLWNRKQESDRWDVFRIGAQSHNVLTFNGKNHNVEGVAEITAHDETSKMKSVELDLTPTFKGQTQEVTRRAELDKNDYLTIVDHVVAGAEPTFVEWKIATRAQAEIISPNMIMLTQDGKSVYLKLRSKLPAEAKIWPQYAYKLYEIKDDGVSRVGFVLELKAGQTADIEVNISPEKGKKSLTLPKLNLLKKKK